MLQSGGNACFYLNDHLGTPQQLVDQSGAVVWSAAYDAYGEAHQDEALVENNLRILGQYFDEETGIIGTDIMIRLRGKANLSD